jgi:predicted MFS family arabinose efflux permease
LELDKERTKSAEFALIAAFAIQGFLAITYLPRIPEIIEQIDVSFALWGLIIGLAGLGSLIPLLITNRLVGKFGTRPIVRISSLMIVLTTASLGFATNGWMYFAFHAAMMFSMSFFNIAVNAQSVMLQKKVKKVILGKFHAAWSIGAGISAAVSGILASFMSLQLHLVLVGLMAIVAFEVSIRSMLKPSEDGHREERQAAQKVPFFKSPNQLWLLAFGFFAGVFPEMVMMDWSAVFAKQVMLLNPTLGAIPFTAFTVAMIAGRLLIGRVTKKYHISDLSKWGGIIGAVAMALGVLVAPTLVPVSPILAMIVLSLFWAVSGFGLAPMVPSFFGAAGHVKGLTTAQALSRMSLVNALAVIVAKIFMGALAQGIGLVWAFMLPVTMMFIAGILAGRVAKNSKRKEAVENAFPLTGPITVVDQL